jgi:hypothetical protein
LKPNTGASDSPLIVCNDKFWAVPWIGAGGPVYVSPIEQYGKVEPGCALINGHKAAVQAVQFNPFDQNILATGSSHRLAFSVDHVFYESLTACACVCVFFCSCLLSHSCGRLPRHALACS